MDRMKADLKRIEFFLKLGRRGDHDLSLMFCMNDVDHERDLMWDERSRRNYLRK